MKILLVDNYDSFTYNLVQCLKYAGVVEPRVVRNDALSFDVARQMDGIILSPGPGIPNEAGMMPDLVRELGPETRILGVCLGHQCIGEVYGARLRNLETVCHGKELETHIILNDYLFEGIATPFQSGRYHSWVIDEQGVPEHLEVLAVDDHKRIMAIRHVDYDIRGIQFHPESILTPTGQQIINNWVRKGASS